MAKAKKPQFGELPPRYCFVLNPYPDMRVSRCPFCEHKTGQRKIPLLIHVAPMHLMALSYTCRYCQACDLLIAHKHAIEHLLTEMFRQYDPEVVGNDYLIMGTVEKGQAKVSGTFFGIFVAAVRVPVTFSRELFHRGLGPSSRSL